VDELIEQSLREAVAEMRDLLKRDDYKTKVYATRTLCWLNATHERTELMRQRTEAYKERCQILNDRTRSTPYRDRQGVGSSSSTSHSPTSATDNPTIPNSSANSASSAVNTPWQDFYRDLPPGSINPWNGEVVPEEHISQIPPEFNDKEAISFLMFPGPKTKADLYRGISALLNHNEQIYHEHNALKAEVRVFRSERLGSITTEKREELLAERYESNKRQRENKPTPFFIKDLTPDEIAALIKREPHPPEIIDVGLPRTHDFHPPSTPPQPPSLPSPTGAGLPSLLSPCPGAGEMSRGLTSDREGVQRVGSSNSSSDSPTSASMSSPQDSRPKTQDASPSPSSAHSVPSAVNDPLPPGHTRDADGNILSPRAAARRANPNRYIFKPKPLNHPTPFTRRAPNSS